MYSPWATAGVVEPYPPSRVAKPALTPASSNVTGAVSAALGVDDGSVDAMAVGVAVGVEETFAEGAAIGVGRAVDLGDVVALGVASREPVIGAPERAATMMSTTTPDTMPISSAVPSSRPVTHGD